jgi:hypothetical protein
MLSLQYVFLIFCLDYCNERKCFLQPIDRFARQLRFKPFMVIWYPCECNTSLPIPKHLK